ncbi:IS630 family transposase [Thermosynechococcaceae cyanobacterium BACA0444]|uniref:IS630 family transposase n=1 Tax=Pseudocalidococcus azoricus BACA0444 TaxID=2918990 RepID=A0AAE4FRD4_9CYAN|nr:IS630 family transposase [Pseudocalidococcus azoricus]MDS3860348.1 IS630 family transposase [Pseudocalidococcus azoricus BACA0444]
MDELNQFIDTCLDSREMKRALAVKMTLQGCTHSEIMALLQVSSGFITKWKQAFLLSGVNALKLGYKGKTGYLSDFEKQQVIQWLKQQNHWNLEELEAYILETFDVVYAAKSSYYNLLHEAGLSWQKAQVTHPPKDPEKVALKKEICEYLETNRVSIESGKTVVYCVDQCHPVSGDICGYAWSKADERIQVPIKNIKDRRTDYGAINYVTDRLIVKPYSSGNSQNTIQFIKAIRTTYLNQKIMVIWDGAAYHNSDDFRKYLHQVNGNKPEQEWSIYCIKLAPYAPEQNPIEAVWLQVKNFLRKV